MKNLLVPALVAIALVGCSTAPQASTASNSSQAAKSDQAKTFSKAQYDKVQNGMTLAEVQKVFGADGKEVTQSESEVMGQKMVMAVHTWQNPDFSNASVTFQNGKVAGKAQINLK